MKGTRSTILMSLITLAATNSNAASMLYAPHNEKNGITCGSCHQRPFTGEWSGFPPPAPTEDDTIRNFICLRCHDGTVDAPDELPGPAAKLHSSLVIRGTAGWTLQCVDCHDPHFQAQLEYFQSDPQHLFLVSGVIDSVSSQGEYSVIGYSYAASQTAGAIQPAWSDPATWSTKTGSGRGLIFITDRSRPHDSAEIVAASNTTITVKGRVDIGDVGKTFGILYGQMIKARIDTPGGVTRDVKFFDANGGFTDASGHQVAGGFVDRSGNPSPQGVCQVCHTQTSFWTADGGGAGHNAGTACTQCHPHDKGFAGAGGASGKHTVHLSLPGVSCSTCHDLNNLWDNQGNVIFKDRQPLAGTGICAVCHQNGTNGAAAHTDYKAGWPDPAYNLSCNDCHQAQPASGNHTTHLARTDIIGCGDCHAEAAQGSTASLEHVDNNIDVFESNPGDLGYPADKGLATAYASCGSTYCHSSAQGLTDPAQPATQANPTWGTSFGGTVARCISCHNTGAHPGGQGPPLTSGGHPKHLPYKFDQGGNCQSCHYDDNYAGCVNCHNRTVNHVNRSIDVVFDPTFPRTATDTDGFYSGAPAPRTPYGSCSALYCHSPGTRASAPYEQPNEPNITWGGTLPPDCSGCHGGDRLSGAPLASGSHPKHIQTYACALCHSYTVAGNRTINPAPYGGQGYSYGHRFHADGWLTIAFDGSVASNASYAGQANPITMRAPGSTPGACFGIYCHSDGTAVASGAIASATTAAWGSGSLSCSACHAFPPAYANGTPKANSHPAHSGFTCNTCHAATTSTGSTISNAANHGNHTYDVTPGPEVSFSYTFAAAGGSCATVSCHGNTDAQWGVANCLACHGVSQGARAAITQQFSGSSHHIQGVALTPARCYQCHWEANADGTVNTAFHGGAQQPGAAIDLVLYGNGVRPTSYAASAGGTALQYFANGSRIETEKLNIHCLSCHRDANNAATPFGDGRTPKQYAWDGNSVDARYSQSGSAAWGKASGTNVTPKGQRIKAFSAHGNAVTNQGGWDLNESWPNTRNGSVNVVCFDCHNSHGSTVSGTTTSYTSATTNGGILKDVTAGRGGSGVTYKPQAGGSADNKNLRNPGASLCLDCHLTANGGASQPWGYQTTFGESQAILGYFDSAYLAPGVTGSQQRYPYKGTRFNAGGHFGASRALSSTPSHAINGLCTPCHDPHGVSPSLGGNQAYGVPLLKGTWMTSPYKEDAAPANNGAYTAIPGWGEGVQYHLDQNTFGSDIRSVVVGVTQNDTQFAGLCLNCHGKSTLTNGTAGGAWKSVDRIHESVKGWGTNAQHRYICSKCHTPHNGSGLPRLMVTNCLNGSHKTRGANRSPIISWGSSSCGDEGCGSGSGRIPGSYSGYGDCYEGCGGPSPGDFTISCHEGKNGSPTDQSWNAVTPWDTNGPSTPTLVDEPNAQCESSCSVTLQWYTSTDPQGHAVEYMVEVDDAQDFASPVYASGWISTTTATAANLPTSTSYSWRVRSRDAVDQEVSAWSSSDVFLLSPPPAPTVTTPTATAIDSSSATLGAYITSNGGLTITSRGTVWGTAANPTGNAAAEGGTATGPFTQARTGLPAGTKIYYRGYAINSTGPGYSQNGSFYTEPGSQAANVTFSSVGSTGMTVNWTRGTGDGVIVLMREGSEVTASPADGSYTGYVANVTFGIGSQVGSGNFVVYRGMGSSVPVLGLRTGVTYYVAVFEYAGVLDTSGWDQGTNYKPLPATGSKATATSGGSYSFTFDYTGSPQTLAIPAGATNILFMVKGAGGGGGREDNVGNQENGQNGHAVTMGYATSGVSLRIYVGGGGAEGSTTTIGSPGGWGYHSGAAGGNGDDYSADCDDWGYGGAGGGGSSAVLLASNGTVITEAGGGAGGRSSDWDGYCYYTYGGSGGAGGGTDIPGTSNATGGGPGGPSGGTPGPGGNGQVVVSYEYGSGT